MSDTHRENLSALVDGELQREQIRFLLRRMDHDAGLRAAWHRYHLMGDGLRREMPLLADAHFADGVLAAIGGAAVSARRRWLQWSAGGAIAAGVAAVALMVAQPPGAPQRQADVLVASAPETTVATQPASAPAVPRWLSATPTAAQLSEPAAAIFYPSGPATDAASPYARQLAPYLAPEHYPTLVAPMAPEPRETAPAH
ncbi:MAG TPA: RseA family anti-sigma factor [Rhodanobacteraceae bacterium]|nr:RseA family anti-sigma factor [Rhodanobacteraceae bacterium]